MFNAITVQQLFQSAEHLHNILGPPNTVMTARGGGPSCCSRIGALQGFPAAKPG
jgi:hypothetical protein